MTTRTRVILFAVALLVALSLGVGLIVWPNYAETKRLNGQIADLYGRMNSFARQAERVDHLARDVREIQRQITSDLKLIPDSPDAELLIGKLSLPIDGQTIRDQTFTTGQPGPAVPGSDIAALALPLSVEMQARFDSIFATLRLAETMDRLVRVTNVRVERDPQSRVQEEDWVDQPLLTASIGLEAVYEPAPMAVGTKSATNSRATTRAKEDAAP